MRPGLPREALYLPFEAGPHRMVMGLVARPPDELIELDERYPGEMAERRALLASRHGDVFAARAGSEEARQEALDRVAAVLPVRFPDWFERRGALLHNHLTGERWDLARPPCDPLELAGRLVQEDLCLIEASGAGPVLQAAILCAPSRWRLHEKIGRPLAGIHKRVPLYADQLSAPVDRLMRHLKPGKLAERLNWSVTDDPALFQVEGKHRTERDPSITAGNAAERLFLRVERLRAVHHPRPQLPAPAGRGPARDGGSPGGRDPRAADGDGGLQEPAVVPGGAAGLPRRKGEGRPVGRRCMPTCHTATAGSLRAETH